MNRLCIGAHEPLVHWGELLSSLLPVVLSEPTCAGKRRASVVKDELPPPLDNKLDASAGLGQALVFAFQCWIMLATVGASS
jgi:hypothetical protein